MDNKFSNPSYPLMYQTSNNSLSFFSNTLNESLEDQYKSAEDLYSAYFSKETKNKK